MGYLVVGGEYVWGFGSLVEVEFVRFFSLFFWYSVFDFLEFFGVLGW